MQNKIKYCISSNARYKDIALPKLLQSLFDCAIEKKDIVIAINASDKNYIEINDGIYYIYSTGSCYTLNGFKQISTMGLDSDFWFLMPDTSSVGINFKHLVETTSDFSKNVNVPYFQAIGDIGLFKQSYLVDNKDIFKKFDNIPSYVAGVAEGIAWLLPDRFSDDINNDCVYYPNHGFDLLPESDVYGNGVLRQTHYLPSIDFYKYMSNYKDKSVFNHKHNL